MDDQIQKAIAAIRTYKGVRLRTAEQLKELVELWNTNDSTCESVAKHFNVRKNTIYRLVSLLAWAGIQMKHRRDVPRHVMAEMSAMEERGVSMNQIAIHFGMAWKSVQKYIDKFRRASKEPKTITVEEILGLPAAQLNIYEANCAHLIDLKRAGYSAAQTELNIPRGPADYMPTPSGYEGGASSGWGNWI